MPIAGPPRTLFLACLVALAATVRADDPPLPSHVELPKMRTTIYVGSVTLTTSRFERSADTWTATYDARVFPWAFWSERGSIAIHVPEADLARLIAGETIEFTGEAENHRRKPRIVTGRALPAGEREGRIKVRIRVDGVELVFDGDYTLGGTP